MESLTQLYRIGQGPSSSHTMGPRFAAEEFLNKHLYADNFRVTLYDSIAATGLGHLTHKAILDVLGKERTELIWHSEISMPEHPNALLFEALNANGNIVGETLYFSIGGGAIRTRENINSALDDVYPKTSFSEIKQSCMASSTTYWEYVYKHEGLEIIAYLEKVWKQMKQSIQNGLSEQGVLPGSIMLRRQAWNYFQKTKVSSDQLARTGLITSYALALSEENAGGGIVVTAPTCGSCGVLPASLYYVQQFYKCEESDIIKALATAGVIGNIIKHNASISGAEVGCQGEVGSACAMASAAICQLLGGSLSQIEYAAEMGLEHHLGLTCDPVDGLVQIPCIERNAYAATRAVTCAEIAILSTGSHHITFDEVTAVMMQTGKDMSSSYRETSKGGLAEIVSKRIHGSR